MSWDLPQPTPTEPDRTEEVEVSLMRRLRSGAHPSAMAERFSLMTRWFVKAFFGGIRFETRCLDNLRDATSRATVVYFMRTRSVIDYLFFNVVFLRHDLPLARFANGLSTIFFRPLWVKLLRLVTWPLRLFGGRFPSGPETFRKAVRAGEATFLFLQRPTVDELGSSRFSHPYLSRLVDLQERSSMRPIFLVPLLLVWDKRPDPFRRTFVDEVFGSRESPGSLRKLVHLFQSVWQSVVRASDPTVQVSSAIDLDTFLRENSLLNRREKIELLRERLLGVFRRERQVIVGPPLKPAPLIRSEVLASEDVDEAVVHLTRTRPAYPSEVRKEAKKIIKEIAANFNLVTIKFLSAMLNPVFETLYQGFEIDASGLDRVRQQATRRRLVLLPSHKSHMDYLILSNVFYQHGLMPPHIAAGVNLSFWPLGPLFRRAGAFFLRRSFKGDILYSAIFNQYLATLLREGFPIEFFIEGTRSRTGKLCRPRYGMLSMVVNSALSADLKDVVLVPISVGYEKILESGSYTQESLGAEKKAENISGVLKAGRFLKSKHGRLYIEFEQHIELDDFLKDKGVTRTSPKDDRASVVRLLAAEVIERINRATTVTPSALVAMALLNGSADTLEWPTLLSHVGFLVNLLIGKEARLSSSIRGALAVYHTRSDSWSLAGREHGGSGGAESEQMTESRRGAPGTDTDRLPNWEVGRALGGLIEQTLSLLQDYGWVKYPKSKQDPSCHIHEDHRPDLGYLRNTIVHFFLPEMLLSASLALHTDTELDEQSLLAGVLELADFLSIEFGTDDPGQVVDRFHLALYHFIRQGWLAQELPGDRIARPVFLPLPVQYLARLLSTWLESYWLVSIALKSLLDEPMEAKEFVKHCLRLGNRQAIVRTESINKPTFETALEWFEEKGIVATVDDRIERRKSNRLLGIREDYRPDERWCSVGGRLREYLNAIEKFSWPLVPFEQATAPEDGSEPGEDGSEPGEDGSAKEPPTGDNPPDREGMLVPTAEQATAPEDGSEPGEDGSAKEPPTGDNPPDREGVLVPTAAESPPACEDGRVPPPTDGPPASRDSQVPAAEEQPPTPGCSGSASPNS